MEYFECGDLGQLIKDDDLSENDIKSVATQLLEGLKIMHENNFCHRDLKPNVSIHPFCSCLDMKTKTQGRISLLSNGFLSW